MPNKWFPFCNRALQLLICLDIATGVVNQVIIRHKEMIRESENVSVILCRQDIRMFSQRRFQFVKSSC